MFAAAVSISNYLSQFYLMNSKDFVGIVSIVRILKSII